MTEPDPGRNAGARLSCRAVERLVCEIWSDYFGRPVAPFDDFFELGGDSLAMIDVVAEARGRGLAVRSSVALRNPTPARLAESLTGDSRWIARLGRPADTRLRMFCFPHVGSGAAAFNSWLDQVPAGVELCAIRLPGRENRLQEPLMDDWRELAGGLEQAMVPLLDVPFVLVGHCSGSVLAYELARRLRAAGAARPEMLVLSSAEGPAVRRIDEPLHLLPRDELLRRVVNYGGMAPEVLSDPDLMDMFERILRADYRVIERLEYSAGPPLDVPITVVGGRRDEFVSPADMAAWAAETTREFSLHLLDAGHYVLREAGALVTGVIRDLVQDLVGGLAEESVRS
jgi:medium-chain acyl-[acyl-carrier-protein] hydrolase